MKKVIIIYLVIFFISATLFSENQKVELPDGVSSNAFLIDKNELIPIPKDNIIVSTFYNVKGVFEIYACNDFLNWIYLGNIDITKYADYKSLKTKEKVRNYRYYCVDSKEDGIEYNILCRNNDIVIKAKKKDMLKINNNIIENGFFILDYSDIDADDYFKIENTTTKSNFKIQLYVFDTDKEDWIFAGAGSLKGYGDVDTIKTDFEVWEYSIVALIVDNKMNFTCKATERNSDLYIELCDIENDVKTEIKGSIDIDEIEEQLIKLKKLYDKGYIDQEEYKIKKSQILGI